MPIELDSEIQLTSDEFSNKIDWSYQNISKVSLKFLLIMLNINS